MKIIITLILFFGFHYIYAQTETDANYRIILASRCSICNVNWEHELKIELMRTNEDMKVVYRILDSVQVKKFKNDPIFKLLDDEMMKLKLGESDSLSVTKLIKLKNRYTVFYTDSLNINKLGNTELFESADLLGLLDAKFETDVKPQTEIILDGNYFNIYIRDYKNVTNTYSIYSLSKSRNPITYKLVKDLLNFYRTNKPGTVLEKSYKTFYL